MKQTEVGLISQNLHIAVKGCTDTPFHSLLCGFSTVRHTLYWLCPCECTDL